MNQLRHFAKDESGVTAIEYGLLAAAIGLMLTVAMPALRDPLAAIFQAIDAGFEEVAPPVAAP